MNRFLALTDTDQAAAVQETSVLMKLHPVAVEKDFWVCWMLRELFSLQAVGEHLIFKGGTSLSKVYGVIKRFSEDIDVALDSNAFGVAIEEDFDTLTKSQRDNRLKRLHNNALPFVRDTLYPALKETMGHHLRDDGWELELESAGRDLYTLNFEYPKVLPDTTVLTYARPVVRIELGIRAEHEPSEIKEVTPYVADRFPDLFEHAATPVKVLSAHRTFWEKVTLLHAESSRPASEPLPPRLARHTYDLHQLMVSEIGEEALQQRDLLERVARHKTLFYAQKRVDYEKAHSGYLQIMPAPKRLVEIRKDYDDMGEFLVGEPPNFDDILISLEHIQSRTNAQ